MRALIKSRWFLVPASLLIGVAIGGGATLGICWPYFRDTVNRNWAMKASLSSNIAADIDAGQGQAARDVARHELATAANSMASNGADGPEFASLWRSLATYAALSPGLTFSPDAQAILGRYPALTADELDSSHCVAGVCMLARQSHPTSRPSTPHPGAG